MEVSFQILSGMCAKAHWVYNYEQKNFTSLVDADSGSSDMYHYICHGLFHGDKAGFSFLYLTSLLSVWEHFEVDAGLL